VIASIFLIGIIANQPNREQKVRISPDQQKQLVKKEISVEVVKEVCKIKCTK
jgi:hypothetical protein